MMYRLYIGSNNDTKELELDKIKQIVSRYYDGFTIILATGYWKGAEEKTAIVEISTDSFADSLNGALIAILRKELKQEAIGVQTAQALTFN